METTQMNWLEFLNSQGIDFVTRSSNTKKGEVSVRCPWCGDDDPSMHLGISLTAENWGCHRNPMHRGHAPHRLIAALLGCSGAQARLIVRQFSQSDPDDLDSALEILASPEHTGTGLAEPQPALSSQASPSPTQPHYTTPQKLPEEFRTIRQRGVTLRFWDYLFYRGFGDDTDQLTDMYQLRCAVTGRWKDRVIIPFYDAAGTLIGWTGRAIQEPVNAPRYLSSGEEVKTTVFNEHKLQSGGDLLFMVEGPFDALKMDFYGRPLGARATCVFGVSMTIDQISIMSTLRRRFKKVVILFDHDAIEPAFYAADWLQASNVVIGQLPDGVKDPGSMSKQAIAKLVVAHK